MKDLRQFLEDFWNRVDRIGISEIQEAEPDDGPGEGEEVFGVMKPKLRQIFTAHCHTLDALRKESIRMHESLRKRGYHPDKEKVISAYIIAVIKGRVELVMDIFLNSVVEKFPQAGMDHRLIGVRKHWQLVYHSHNAFNDSPEDGIGIEKVPQVADAKLAYEDLGWFPTRNELGS